MQLVTRNGVKPKPVKTLKPEMTQVLWDEHDTLIPADQLTRVRRNDNCQELLFRALWQRSSWQTR